jgi:GntR family transcriptional regulator
VRSQAVKSTIWLRADVRETGSLPHRVMCAKGDHASPAAPRPVEVPGPCLTDCGLMSTGGTRQRGHVARRSQRETGRLSALVRDRLSAEIATGVTPPGTKLPPEPELAAELGVSRATLREALRSLEEDGLITRTPGAGTFVTHRPRLTNNLDVNFSVTEAIAAAGGQPGTRVLRIWSEVADAEHAERLRLAVGDPVVSLERIRTANGRPVVYSQDSLPAALIHDSEALQELTTASIYDLLERKFGIVVQHGVAVLRPARADRLVAAKLGVPRGTIMMAIKQVDYDDGGRPVLFSREYHLADAFEFAVVRRGPGRGHRSARRIRPAGGRGS